MIEPGKKNEQAKYLIIFICAFSHYYDSLSFFCFLSLSLSPFKSKKQLKLFSLFFFLAKNKVKRKAYHPSADATKAALKELTLVNSFHAAGTINIDWDALLTLD